MLVRSIKPRGFSRRDTIFPKNACRGYTPGTLEAVALTNSQIWAYVSSLLHRHAVGPSVPEVFA